VSDAIAHRLYYAESDFRAVDRVAAVAKARGVKPAQIALAWLLGKPAVVAPIIGASRMEHLEDALGALEIRLRDDEVRALEDGYEPHNVVM
jgi:aryl-alcohol dehydrogenase (NADP+)